MTRLENLLGAQSLELAGRLLDADVGGSGMAASERAALVTLLAHPDRTVRWLGDVLGLTSSGGTRLVERLVDAGWVTRTAGTDARQRRLDLTRTGRARARAVLKARQAVIGEVVEVLTEQERRQLEALLDKMVVGLAATRLPALHVCRLCDRAACSSGGRECPLRHTMGTADD
ncbi:DNA-binding MarR family transcriptional regulator [Kibdelosporangium banguiense]|uniref:DNA-binding MarR family transcriptional regulator n=1 Tax=Kibdelosporangium banguiense TaxID=1365924 RepID=A0ABS4TNB6_9PSEU|nr:MarR family winged helix-turn-helix transcriptional regulator [Kibdelosporangium banguiense]MBP2325900.1 DNA-binding MarR family transcriptional regulator [Kibdelosporangium banguiense]